MIDINIESIAGNRVRLKSDIFLNLENINLIEKKLQNYFLSFRANNKCKSIIFNYKNNETTIEDLIKKIQTLFGIEEKKEKIKLSMNACNSLQSCNSCTKKEPISWKRKIVEFSLLSLFSAYLFVKESILGIAVASNPLSLVAAVSLVAAYPLLKESIEHIKNKNFNLQIFMSVTLILAILAGEATAAFEIIYILRGGMLLEEYISEKSKNEIHKLIELDMKSAYILVDGVEIEVDINDIKNGDIVVSRSGEKIPVDGIIQDGSAEINEAIINGRSEAAFKQENEKVYAGTLIEKGRVYIKVNAIGKNTFISRVMGEVEESLKQKSPSEVQADILAKRLLKLGTFLTIGTLLATGSLINAFSVMIVMSCPCATVLAASTAISAGISNGAKKGILIKGGEYLEKVSQSDVFCFDKTGTLTTGKPQITDIITNENIEENTLIKYCAIAEYRNSHPIAKSIIEYTKSLDINIDQNAKSDIIAGQGVISNFEDEKIFVGNKRLFENQNIDITPLLFKADKLLEEGKTVIFVAKENTLLGILAFNHEVREGTKEMIKSLRDNGVKHIALLTGDEKVVANNFALEYGFDEVYSNLLPNGKAQVVEELKTRYKNVVMVGDGVNDTLAMSKADVAISFAAGGSQAAIEVSNIAITHSDPKDIVELHKLSSDSLKIVNQNYYLGTGTNLLGVGLAAVGKLSPVAAGGIHIAHTLGIMLNSSRLAISKS